MSYPKCVEVNHANVWRTAISGGHDLGAACSAFLSKPGSHDPPVAVSFLPPEVGNESEHAWMTPDTVLGARRLKTQPVGVAWLSEVHMPDGLRHSPQAPDASFHVSVTHRDARVLLLLDGEVDISARGRLQAAFADAQKSATEVVVDVSGVTFMDSTGINALVRARKSAPDGARLQVVGASGQVRRVLETTGVADLVCEGGPETKTEGSAE
jgi:anti-sigma B factor antagonist